MKGFFLFLLLQICVITHLSYCKCSCRPGCCNPTNPRIQLIDNKKENKPEKSQKEIIKEAYGKVAKEGGSYCIVGGGCCGGGADLSEYIGYSKEELDAIPEANLGLGCGNPLALGKIQEGAVVVDLGSGAGIDCFIAAKKVGPTGRVIGIDMTEDMVRKAQENAKRYGISNVEFYLSEIENLPLGDGLADIVLSNCVINLVPDKLKVFQEAYRVLKSGGKMYVSDVVLLGKLSPDQKNDPKLLCACVSGAIQRDEYIRMLEEVGFIVMIIDEDTEINKKWFNDDSLPIESLKYIAEK